MAASLAQLAKRAFVSLLLALAQQYRVRVTLSRDSADHVVEAAFRSVVKKVHPDKGGAVGDAQRLQQAREEWKAAKAKGPRPGRRPVTAAAAVLTAGERETQSRKSFRIRSSAVLLTYHGIALGALTWQSGGLESGALPWRDAFLVILTSTSCCSFTVLPIPG